MGFERGLLLPDSKTGRKTIILNARASLSFALAYVIAGDKAGTKKPVPI
jgi:hypothetical protein